MNNRDYFTRPNQGNGRDHQSYGNTRFEPESRATVAIGWLSLLLVSITIYYIAWEFTR